MYILIYIFFFFFNDTATTEIYTLSLHDAFRSRARPRHRPLGRPRARAVQVRRAGGHARALAPVPRGLVVGRGLGLQTRGDPAPLRRPQRAGARRPVLRRLRPGARAAAPGGRRAARARAAPARAPPGR